MMIRAGLLHVPVFDEGASAAVRALLARVEGLVVVQESSVLSQRNWIAQTLRTWCDEEELDLVLTLGGTFPAPGPSPAESVPEATLEVLERMAPGLSEAMRAEAQSEWPLAILDRGVAGIRGRSLLLNLPAGDAAALFLDALLDVLPACCAALQEQPAAPLAQEGSPRRGLNADDFAAWLAKQNRG